jgi:hypothetical protein
MEPAAMLLTEPLICASAIIGITSIGAVVGLISITIMDLMHYLHN